MPQDHYPEYLRYQSTRSFLGEVEGEDLAAEILAHRGHDLSISFFVVLNPPIDTLHSSDTWSSTSFYLRP